MGDCTATLNTATFESLHFFCDDDHDEDVLCSGWGHVTIHTLTCSADNEMRWSDSLSCAAGWHETEEGEVWHNDTPGAGMKHPVPACDHCRGGSCMSPTHRGTGNACCICGDHLPDPFDELTRLSEQAGLYDQEDQP